MRFGRLDLNLLVALDVLLEERNVSRAAARLNLSQSAMSGALARLREFFGDDLLVQIGRSMTPTPLAVSLEAPVRDILLRVQMTIEARPDFDPATAERTFRVIGSDYITEVLLALVMQRLRRQAPGIRLEITPPDELAIDKLNNGAADIMISPEQYLSRDHPSAVLFEEGYRCVVCRDNAKIGDTMSIEEYLAMGHVAVRFGKTRTPSFEQWFLDSYAIERRIEVVVSDFTSVPRFIVGTDLIGTMHGRLAALYCDVLPLRSIPAPIGFPVLKEMMQWHRHFDRDPALVWLRGVMMDCASRASGP